MRLLVQSVFFFFLRLYYISPQDPASFSAQDALGINLGYVVKETVSRIPASFAAVIGNCVVNEADECLHPFPSIAHTQIPFLSYFPDSHSLPPSCNAFDQAFCPSPTTSHLQEWHLHPVWYYHPSISNGDRLPPHTIWAAAGKARTQEKQAMWFPQPGLSSQGELLCKLPLDPEITNL